MRRKRLVQTVSPLKIGEQRDIYALGRLEIHHVLPRRVARQELIERRGALVAQGQEIVFPLVSQEQLPRRRDDRGVIVNVAINRTRLNVWRHDDGRNADAQTREVERGNVRRHVLSWVAGVLAVGIDRSGWSNVVVQAAVLVVYDREYRTLPNRLVGADRVVDILDKRFAFRDVVIGVLVGRLEGQAVLFAGVKTRV